MPLSWNEIKHRAIKFGNDWKTETREDAERQTFWNEFFDIFGIKRRSVASGRTPFTQRIIVTTTNDWSEHAEDALLKQQPPVYKEVGVQSGIWALNAFIRALVSPT